MSITVNGQSSVPPGFRFHPTEEELLNYYLRKKVASEMIDLDVIRDVDLNKLEPWDIQEKCRIGSTPQNDWYFFSHKDKKYPTGTRTNRATAAGFWKATGRDKIISSTLKRIGMRKTLVFYKGRAPHGQKSDWIMHEYRLDDQYSDANASSSIIEATGQEDGWVVCRVFKKKNNYKASDNESKSLMLHSASDGALDQIIQYMGRSCKQETETITNMSIFGGSLHDRFMKLPALENHIIPSFPVDMSLPNDHSSSATLDNLSMEGGYQADAGMNDWAAMDRLVALHLNGQSEASRQLSCFDDPCFGRLVAGDYNNGVGGSEGDEDLWSFTRSASASASASSPTTSATCQTPSCNGLLH